LKIEKKFDAIYSNKVLHHLITNDSRTSIQKQKEILNPCGILFHFFGDGIK